MAVTTTEVLGLGAFTRLDTNDNTTGADNASALLNQTFGSAANPVWRSKVSLAMNDGNNNNSVAFGNQTASPTEFIRVGGGAPRSVDTGLKYNADIYYWDGSGPFRTEVRVIQDGAGNLYILPPPRNAPNAEITAMTLKPIQSITFVSIAQNNYTGLDTSRFGLPGDPTFPCFVAGTLIETEAGPVRVEDLSVGDMVLTLDGSAKPIRWIGSRHLGSSVLSSNRNMRPIRIAAGALGENLPNQDLLVSPQHRMLIRSRISQRMFDSDEVLVAAKHLCELAGVTVADDVDSVEYFHLLFDQHEVVIANGAESESLYTGHEALAALGPEVLAEILAIFPELATDGHDLPVRPLANGRRARQLAARHSRNDVALTFVAAQTANPALAGRI